MRQIYVINNKPLTFISFVFNGLLFLSKINGFEDLLCRFVLKEFYFLRLWDLYGGIFEIDLILL